MSIRQEQLARQQQASIETGLALIGIALDSAERLFSLHLAISRSLLSQQARLSRDLFAIRQPQELLSLQAAYTAPLLGYGLAYVRNAFEIAAQGSSEAGQLVEANGEVVRHSVSSFIDRVQRSAPGGIGQSITVLDSALSLFVRIFHVFEGTLFEALSGQARWPGTRERHAAERATRQIEHKEAA